MIIELDLPLPSKKILQAIYRIAEAAPLELELKAMHDRVQDYTRNSVSRKFIEDDEELNRLSQLEFGHLFEEKFKPAAGIIKNLREDQVACWPPHADRVRIFALNFYIQEGGKYVTTVMYNASGDNQVGPGTGSVFKYEDLTIDTSYHLEIQKWYALSVRQAHSIENIEGTRLIFTLSFFDTTCDEFIKKYPNYIKRHIADN
jgi:hypothetical protein